MLRYFQSLLNQNTFKSDVKKAVDANLEFLATVFRGHILTSACKELEILTLDGNVPLPPSLTHSSTPATQQLKFVESIASHVVDECTLISSCGEVVETDDKVYIMREYFATMVHSLQSSKMLVQRGMVIVCSDAGVLCCHTSNLLEGSSTAGKR